MTSPLCSSRYSVVAANGSLRLQLRMRLEGGLEGIELGPLLGRGSYGKVYKGEAASHVAHPASSLLLGLLHCFKLRRGRKALKGGPQSPTCTGIRHCEVFGGRGCSWVLATSQNSGALRERVLVQSEYYGRAQ